MAEHLGKRKRRSSSLPCPNDRSTETEVIHPSSRVIKQRSRSPELRHGASAFQSSRKGRPKTSVEDTTGHGSLTTHSHVDLRSRSPVPTIDKATAPQEIYTSKCFDASSGNTSRFTASNGALANGTTNILTAKGPNKPEVNPEVPYYALTWTEHDLRESLTSDDSMGDVNQGVFPHHEHSCTAIPKPDGEFIIFGGRVEDEDKTIRTNNVFLLSTTDMSLTNLETNGVKPKGRSGHRAVIAGRVLVVFGGTQEDSSLYFLNLDTREWSKFRPPAPYPGPRFGHSFIIVHNTIWLYGGLQPPVEMDDMWCLDLGNAGIEQVRWRKIPKKDSWPQARSYHSTVYYDGSLYLFAGATDTGGMEELWNDVWRFEISTETWTKIQCHGQVPQPRSSHTATVIGDNMFTFGGVIEGTEEGTIVRTDDAFVFNLQDHTWWSLAMLGRMPLPTQGGVMSTLGSRLVLVGGVQTDKKKLIYTADIRAAGSVLDSLAKLQFTTETNQLKFTTEVVDLSRFVRKQGDAAHSLAGFSDVWKGELTETGKAIAIKVLRVASTGNPDDPQSGRLRIRFDRELTIWMECQHPRVLELLGYAYIEGTPCLISPWCSNGNIMEYLAKNANADHRQLINQVAEGLVYLHGREPLVVHSDIKPANIVVSDEGDAKICDFGISKFMLDMPSGFTTTATAKGTVRYSPKELLEEEARSTTMSDVYAFGMLILHVMTGKPPYFKCSTDMSVIMAIMSGKTPARADYPELPSTDPYWDIMLECWSEDPNKRPTMVKILDRLRECVGSEES